MQSHQCRCSTKSMYQLGERWPLHSFLLRLILALSSNVARSCRASCGEFTVQWIKVRLSHRKGFGEHLTPPSHASSPGQIRYGNPTKTRFYPIISVVLLLSGPTTASLSSPFQSAYLFISLSLYLHLRFSYTHALLDLCSVSIEAGCATTTILNMLELEHIHSDHLCHITRQKYTPSLCYGNPTFRLLLIAIPFRMTALVMRSPLTRSGAE